MERKTKKKKKCNLATEFAARQSSGGNGSHREYIERIFREFCEEASSSGPRFYKGTKGEARMLGM